MPSTEYIFPTGGMRATAIKGFTDPAGVHDPDTDVMAADLRSLVDLWTPGVAKPAGGYQVAPSTGLTVLVGSGTPGDLAVVPGTEANQYSYLTRMLDGTAPVTLLAADLSQTRIDEIWIAVLDDQIDTNGTHSSPRLARRTGDPGAGAPGPDAAWTASLLLGTVTVDAGETDLEPGDIALGGTYSDLALAGGGAAPVGMIGMFANNANPAGWLLCNGAAVSRTQFPRLFAAIGETYGVGDGSTTFNVPDARGRMPVAVGGATGLALGDTGGTWDHTHTGPPHTHGLGTDAGTNAAGNHNHGAGSLNFSHHHSAGAGQTGNAASIAPQGDRFIQPAIITGSGTTTTDGNHSHAALTGRTNSGSGTGGINPTSPTGAANPPYFATRYFIKT